MGTVGDLSLECEGKSNDSVIEGDWFFEKSNEYLPGQKFGLQVEEVLFRERSAYQDVLMFRSKSYGNVMVLDGWINSVERDEFIYQEMISHLPLNSHPDPRRVLVVGGGDGGVARECARHPLVQHIDMVEIDQVVIDVCKKYLPDMAVGMSHPKVNVRIEDAFEFLQHPENIESYDVIIADLSDDVEDAPAEKMYTKNCYAAMRACLRGEDGIICLMGDAPWTGHDYVKDELVSFKELFPSVAYATSFMPTYGNGWIGYYLCSLRENKVFRIPVHNFDTAESMNKLKFYNSEMHTAAFALPPFLKKAIDIDNCVTGFDKNC